MKISSYNNTLKKFHILLIVFGTIFILFPVFNENLWFDECYSVGISRQNINDIWYAGSHDVHPILYYVMLKIVGLLTNNSILSFKLFSAIPIILVILLGYTHIRKDFGEKTGFIFSFLSTFLPSMSYYAQEVRMYSWGLLTITLLCIYAWRLLKSDYFKYWILFGLFSTLSIFLHYYGLLTALIINVILLIYLIINKRAKGIKYIIFFGILQIVCYIPWLVSLFSQIMQVSDYFWIEFQYPYTFMEILNSPFIGHAGKPFIGELILLTIFSVPLYIYIIFKVYMQRNKNLKPFYYSTGIYLLVIFIAIIISVFMNQLILYYRYLFILSGLYIFAISYVLGTENNKQILTVILLIILLFGLYNNISLVFDNYSPSNTEFLTYLKQNVKEGDTFAYTNCEVGSVVAVNFINNDVYFITPSSDSQQNLTCFGPNYIMVSPEDFLKEDFNRIWVIDSIYFPECANFIDTNSKYKIIDNKLFTTKYHKYEFNISLLEKTEH